MAVMARMVATRDAHGWGLTVRPPGVEHWRRAVVDALEEWNAPRSSVELAYFGVSELLANVIKYADGCCRLEVTRVGLAVWICVFDRSSKLPMVSEPSWDSESGRGLWLLRQMAGGENGMGFERVNDPWAKVVWFRCGLTADAEGAAA